jgi:hypothetical protein
MEEELAGLVGSFLRGPVLEWRGIYKPSQGDGAVTERSEG